MADNYLEKKMQDYLAGAKGRQPSARVLTHKHIDAIVFAEVATLPLKPSFAQAIGTLAECGAKVGLYVADCDVKAGREAAQQTGARFLPFRREEALSYITKTWGKPTVYISDSDGIDTDCDDPDATNTNT